MRTALTAAVLLSLMVAAPRANADQFLADFQGYDWTWPLPSCLNCPGQYYEFNAIVGSVNPAYLTANFTTKQYTITVGDNLFLSNVQTFGTTVVASYVNGKIAIYEDAKPAAGTAATYNLNHDCDPFEDRLTFADGTAILSGVFTSFDIIYDSVTGDGNINGLATWNGGSQLANIPLNQRSGWTYGAIGVHADAQHCGYHWQVDGNCTLQEPVPVEPTTWGAVKSQSWIRR